MYNLWDEDGNETTASCVAKGKSGQCYNFARRIYGFGKDPKVAYGYECNLYSERGCSGDIKTVSQAMEEVEKVEKAKNGFAAGIIDDPVIQLEWKSYKCTNQYKTGLPPRVKRRGT